MKWCRVCGEEKPLKEMSKHKKCKDGYNTICKKCACIASKKSRLANRDYYNSVRRKYRKRDYVKKQRAEYARNRQASLTEEEREDQKIKHRQWRQNNPGLAAIYCQRRRHKVRQLDESYSLENRNTTLSLFDNKCFNCGSINTLQIDHHYPLNHGYALTMSNAVVLCKSCNSAKSDKMPENFYPTEKLIQVKLILGPY